jgi:hypothetical protein
MMATQRETIRIRNWSAVPTGDGTDYYIYDHRGQPHGCRGLARNEEQARQWLNDATGITYESLPAVRLDDLTVITGEKIKIGEFPNRGSWYRHTVYKLGDKELGRIQTKCRKFGKGQERIETLTCVGDGCVQGSDVRWLLQQNGLRLV